MAGQTQGMTSRRVRDGALIVLAAASVVLSFVVQFGGSCNLVVTDQRMASVSPPRRTLLTKLAGSDKPIQCAEGLVPVPDTVLDPALAWTGGRKIPRVVHVTSRSRCMTKEFAENLDKWRFKDHSFFMHDDDAMDELLYRHWPEFPQLQQVQKCLKYGGAVKADIWRALILYEYGGIYTDIDNAPHKFNGTTIQPEDDAFFQIDISGYPSQWFMAVAPRHPMLYLTIEAILYNIAWNIKDTGNLKVIWTTGPGAVEQGFRLFSRYNKDDYPAGHYVGTEGRSARLVGDREDQDEYVWRNMIKDKEDLYEKMNMTHLVRMGMDDNGTNLTCLEHLYRAEEDMKGPYENALLW
jgi:hypothetical protein